MIDAAEERVVDCDWHYQDSFTEVAKYMPEPWRTKYKNSNWEDAGVTQALSSFFPTSTGDRQNYGKVLREHSNYPDEPEEPERVREGMDFLDVDVSLQISHLILATGGINADDERIQAFTRGYIEYMLAEVLDPDDGVYGLAPVPYGDIDASLRILDRVEDEEAFVGACFVTAGASPPLGN
ncbi:amidohydrolase, partial [Halobellus litoreus]